MTGATLTEKEVKSLAEQWRRKVLATRTKVIRQAKSERSK